MSWLFSRALVEEYSADISLDGEQCALLNGTPTQPASWLPGKTTEACRLSRSGMTYKPLTADHGEAVLTSFLEAFPVKTSAPSEKALELKERGQACGNTCVESSERFVLDLSSSKTLPCSSREDLLQSCETLPKSGMMRDGKLLELTTRAFPIIEKDSGWWATPAARDYKDTPGMSKTREAGRKRIDQLPRQVYASLDGSGLFTPPTVPMTETALPVNKIFPYVIVQDLPLKNINLPISETHSGQEQKLGLLNPEFSEWLMGWPIGWTDLKPLETDKFQQWLNLHGKP